MKNLLSSTEKQETLLFEIYPLGQRMQNGDLPNPIQCGVHECKIVWITNGAGRYESGLAITSLLCGHLFCLHHARQRIITDQDVEGIVISFSDRLLSMGEIGFDLAGHANLYKLFSKSGGLLIKGKLETDLTDLVARMRKENADAGLFSIEVLTRYLKIFFIYLTREFNHTFQPVAPTRAMEYADRFMAMLEQNFRTRKMVSDYANCLFVTPNYLNEVVKKVTGYAASHHIRQRILAEAKRMALCSDHNMKEIAYMLGFEDCAHFSKFFKVLTGNNFTEFKRQRPSIGLAV